MVADLATGELVREPYTFRQRISRVGLAAVAGVPVLVVDCHGTVFCRYLHDADRERWWQAAAPPIREDKALPDRDLNDTSAAITISTRGAVGGIALAEPDLCVVGTTKGILAVRLRFPGLRGSREPRSKP